MLDKFLNKINGSAFVDNSITKKITEYNQEVLVQKNLESSNEIALRALHLENLQANFSKPGGKQFKPNTYQTFDKKDKKEYVNDGSLFCSYSIGGNTLVCYKDKEKVEIILYQIIHPDKNNSLAKRANYFLNELVKKKKIFIEEKSNAQYEVYLDSKKETSINQLLINEGFNNSESVESAIKKSNFDKKIASSSDTSNTIESESKEKKNYAYGLFATNHNTFEALFNNNKITLKLADLELDSISKEDQKTCKSMIYDFVSKKNIILKFKKEENNIHYAEVFNKEGESLNSLIAAKNFKTINNLSNEDLISEKIQDNSEDRDVPEVTVLHSMFKQTLVSKPNSPFAKKKPLPLIENNNVASENENSMSNLNDDKDIPEITVLHPMFKQVLISKPNSPFAKKKPLVDIESNNISANLPLESTVEKKKSSFSKR